MSSNGPRASLRLLVALLAAVAKVFVSVLNANRAEREAASARAEAELAAKGAQIAHERALAAAQAALNADAEAYEMSLHAAQSSAVADGRLTTVLDAAV